MEPHITLQDVANLATFVAPGYFAVRLYSTIHAKRDKDFPQLLIECLVFSVPIIAVINFTWAELLRRPLPSSTSWPYMLAVLAVAFVSGTIAAKLRASWPLRGIARRLGLGEPDEDLFRAQFKQLVKGQFVTVTLKDGEVFSGKPRISSAYVPGTPREYFFDDLAWYNPDTGRWDKRPGGLMLNLADVKYIETPRLK